MNTAMYRNKTWKIGGELEVNRFGFGAMRLTGPGIIGEPANIPEAIRVLRKAVDLGINFMDTADSYGPYISEDLIAKALFPYPDNLVIATKGGQIRPGPNQWVPDGRPEHLKAALEGSLKRLKLERIDLYQLHRKDPKVPFSETLGFLKQAQDKGLIRFIGLSELDISSVQEAQKQIEVVSLQNKYNLVHRKWEKELEYCNKNNIAFIPWNPINAGRPPANSAIDNIALKYGSSVEQIELKWLFHHSGNILLIPGTSNLNHLEENWKAQDTDLSEKDYKIICESTIDKL